MKVLKEVGSKERFLEMFQKVNKVRLNEAFGQNLNPQIVLEDAYNNLKNGTLPITERKTETKGNLSYVQFLCVDREGNNIGFTFKAQIQEGDQEGVYDIIDVILDSFSFDSVSDEVPVEMKGETLNQFNAQHKGEMFDIVDEDINVEQGEEIDSLYEDATKLIDKIPYKVGSENMVTHKQYADEKPTNADVRVNADELKKFVKEGFSTPDTKRIIDKTVIDSFNRLDPKIKERYLNQAKQDVEQEFSAYLGGAQIPQIAYEKMVIARARGVFADEISQKNEGLNENEYPEQLGKEFKPESQVDYAKTTKAKKKHKSKKVKIKESTDRDKFENVVFLQGDEAFDALERLDREGEDAALEYLKQWHYPGDHEGSAEEGHGTDDKVYRKDGYVMSWNPRLGYIGLQYDLSQMNEDDDENPELSQVEKDNPELYPKGWKEMDGMFMNPDSPLHKMGAEGQDDGMSLEPAGDEIEQIAQEKEQVGDLLQGGKAENKSPLEFDPEQMKMGIEVEKEHTDNPMVAVEIATDHLAEIPDYYTRLDAMEKEAKESGEESGEEKPEGEEDLEMTDRLLGYKPKNVGDEIDETIGYDEYKGLMGDKYADAEGNEFAVANKVKGGVSLKGQGGEKEVATGDLDLMKKMDEMGESKESELKQRDPATWHQIQIAKKTLKMPDAMVGVMGGMTKEEAKEILRKHSVDQIKEVVSGNKTKMFKIGEYAIGGIIKVDIIKNSDVVGGEVAISALDWNTKQPVQGSRFVATNTMSIDNYLNELTSSYFAGKVMEWIQENTGVDSRPNYFGNQNW